MDRGRAHGNQKAQQDMASTILLCLGDHRMDSNDGVWPASREDNHSDGLRAAID